MQTSSDIQICDSTEVYLACIDKDWSNNWLSKYKIFGSYEDIVSLKDLSFQKLSNSGNWQYLPLYESYVYKYLKGSPEEYYLDLNLRSKIHPANFHTEERMLSLFSELEKKGEILNKNFIVVNSENQIMDGFHRASWLLYKFGCNHKVRVLRIFGSWSDEVAKYHRKIFK